MIEPRHGDDVVVLALARDCAPALPAALAALRAWAAAGLRTRALVGEDGSRDGTRTLLLQAEEEGLLEVVDTAAMAVHPERLERMAVGRQLLLDRWRSDGRPARAVVVVDLDEPFLSAVGPARLSAELDRLEGRPDLFAVAATSRPTYYDLLAFEDDERSYPGLLDGIAAARRGGPLTYYRFFRDSVWPEQRALTRDEDLACTSAFNGLCVYDASAYREGSYLAAEGSDRSCEHVVLHRSIAASTGRRMLVSSRLVLPTPAEHAVQGPVGFAAQRLRKLVGRPPRR